MFSNVLKQLRKDKKVTQESLAEIIGVERSTIGKYESTNTIPSPDILIKLADFFNVTIDYLLEHNQPKVEKINDNSDKLYQAYISANDNVREAIDKLLGLG